MVSYGRLCVKGVSLYAGLTMFVSRALVCVHIGMSKRLATSFNSIMCSKRQSLTLEKKIDLLDKLKALPSGKSQRELADELQVPRATLQKLVANEATLRKEAENLTMNDMQLVKKRNRA